MEHGVYEARIVASMVYGGPTSITGRSATPSASTSSTAHPTRGPWLEPWAARPQEYIKRAAFALLWSLALHDKSADDARFVAALDLVECEGNRSMVTKGIQHGHPAETRHLITCMQLGPSLAPTL